MATRPERVGRGSRDQGRRSPGRPDLQDPYVLFARGPLNSVAERMPKEPDDVGRRVPLLHLAEAEAMAPALGDTVRRVVAPTAAAMGDFAAALGDLGLPGSTIYPLLSLLVLDGLVGPAVVDAAAGGEGAGGKAAAVFAVSTLEPVPFHRTCVRPGGSAIAAAYPCGTIFPWAGELEEIFRVRSVQRCLASRDAREEVLAEKPAQDQLDRINALRYHNAAFEFHAYNRLPVLTAERLTAVRAQALGLATAILSAGGGPEAMAGPMSEVGGRVLASPFEPADRVEAALGVFFDELVSAWVQAGDLPEPGPYRVKEAGQRVLGAGRPMS
ncbi:MAG: hypothetical protein ACYC9Q_08955 [Bacillota bacterium]